MKNAESCNGFPPSVTLWENCGHHPPGSRADLFNWLLEQPQNMMVPAAHSVYGGGEEVHRSQEGHRAGKTAWPSAQSGHARLVRGDRRQLFQARQPHDH